MNDLERIANALEYLALSKAKEEQRLLAGYVKTEKDVETLTKYFEMLNDHAAQRLMHIMKESDYE